MSSDNHIAFIYRVKKNYLLVLFIISSVISQAQSLFNKRYGSPSYDIGKAIAVTMDGGYITSGYTEANGAGGDIFVIKLSQQGNIQWQKHIFGINNEQPAGIYQLSNGNYIIGGQTYSYGSGLSDILFVMLDSAGNFVWSKSYGDIQGNTFYRFSMTTNSGFIGCGANTLIKIDQNGSLLWLKNYTNGTGLGSFISVAETSDGGYLTHGAGNDELDIFKTDAGGNPLWLRRYTNIIDIYSADIQALSDGSAVITGNVRANAFGGADDIFLLKIDQNGNRLWFKRYGFTYWEYGTSVKKTFDSGFIISGYTNSFGHGDHDAFLLKTDSSGNFQWAKTYGDAWMDRAFEVQTTNDSGYVFVGDSYSSTNTDSSYVYVVRTDQNGVTSCNYLDWTPLQQTEYYNPVSLTVTATNFGTDSSCTTPVLNEFFIERDFCPPLGLEEFQTENHNVYPNPSDGNFTINFNNNPSEKAIQIFDITGNIIYEKNKINNAEEAISLTTVANGIYFLKVINKDKTTVDKIVIQ